MGCLFSLRLSRDFTSVRGESRKTLVVVFPPRAKARGSPGARISACSCLGAEAPSGCDGSRLRELKLPARGVALSRLFLHWCGSTAQGARRKPQADSHPGAEAPAQDPRRKTQDSWCGSSSKPSILQLGQRFLFHFLEIAYGFYFQLFGGCFVAEDPSVRVQLQGRTGPHVVDPFFHDLV